MRLAFNIALVISVFFLPWWLGALVLIAGCLVIERFYESVAYGVLFDSLYAAHAGVHGFAYWGSAIAFCAFLLSLYLRDKVSWN